MNIFQEATGAYSMRRVLAFLFALASIAAGITGLFFAAQWQAAAAAAAVCAASSIILLLCTTAEDIASLVSVIKPKGNND